MTFIIRCKKLKLSNIRCALPKTNENTLMQKAISKGDVIYHISGQYDNPDKKKIILIQHD